MMENVSRFTIEITYPPLKKGARGLFIRDIAHNYNPLNPPLIRGKWRNSILNMYNFANPALFTIKHIKVVSLDNSQKKIPWFP
jgi:hypothetical protein